MAHMELRSGRIRKVLGPGAGKKATEFTDVLGLVVQHQGGTLGLTDLCSLLRVSSSCRLAVQQTRSKLCVRFDWSTEVDEDAEDEEGSDSDNDSLDPIAPNWEQRRAQLQGFAEWLPKHAGLIGGLDVDCKGEADEVPLLQRHLALALQVCRLNAAAAAAATDGGGDIGSARSKPVLLRLEVCSIRGSFPEQQLLRELGAAGLQKLVLRRVDAEPDHVGASCFDQLASLQSLRLHCKQEVLSAGLQAAIERLTALTFLELQGGMVDAGFRWPPMLQDLTLPYSVPYVGGVLPPTLDISTLAGLQRLDLTLKGPETVGLQTLALPPNLTALWLGTAEVSLGRVTGAGSLCQVFVRGANAARPVLTRLNQLPHVRSLGVERCVLTTPEASAAVAAALGAAKGLTGLCLLGVRFAPGTGLCAQLASLTGLQSLRMCGVTLPGACRSDWLALTGILSLTQLSLTNDWADDVVVAALARNLTGLCDLRVWSDSLSSLALLPVVAALTQLSYLQLFGGPQFVVGADDLMLLSSLTQLEVLSIDTLECSEAEKQQFKARMPRLKRLN